MKRFLLLLLGSITLNSVPAQAAPSVVIKPLTSSTLAPGAEGFALSGKSAVTFANVVNTTSDVVVTAHDASGVQTWSRTIDSSVDEVAMAIASDALGNIYLAGVTADIAPSETPTSTVGVDNPDGVQVDNLIRIRRDLNSIAIWKLSPTGELISTFQSPQGSVALINAMSATASGVSIVGAISAKPFLLTLSTSGQFGKLYSLGTDKTEFNDCNRMSDGSTYIYGSSAETLQGKKVAGKVDGILLTVDKNNKVTQFVRSSAPKALRAWQSADPTFVATGEVITGKVTETAITQFTKAFKPTWTLRIPSAGISRVVSANGITYLAFSSKSAITGVSGWKPSSTQLVVLAFDAKGVIKSAYSFTALTSPIALRFTRESGVVGMAEGAANSVSIFRITSR